MTEPFGPHAAYSLTEQFESRIVERHQVYAMPSTMRALGPMLGEIAARADKDVMIVEPSKFPNGSKSYLKFLGFARLKPLSNRELAASLLFEQINIDIEAMGGINYFARPAMPKDKSACIVTAEIGNRQFDLAESVGNIPSSLETERFRKLFEDKQSILAFVLLHEASHCRDYARENREDFASEIDADRAGIKRYNELVAKGWKLDPEMSAKLRHLRALAPVLQTSASITAIISSFMEIHSSANGFDREARAATDAISEATTFQLVVKSAVYDMLPADKRQAFHQKADLRVERYFALRRQDILKYRPKNKEDMIFKQIMLDLMPKLQRIIGNYLVATMAQKDDPSLTLEALRRLAADPELTIALSRKARIPAGKLARDRLDSWAALGLREDAPETMLSSPPTKPMIDDLTALSHEIQNHMKKATLFQESAPRPAAG